MKLRVEVMAANGVAQQTEEFELSDTARDVLSTVNTMLTGRVVVTCIAEYRIASTEVRAGQIPRHWEGELS